MPDIETESFGKCEAYAKIIPFVKEQCGYANGESCLLEIVFEIKGECGLSGSPNNKLLLVTAHRRALEHDEIRSKGK